MWIASGMFVGMREAAVGEGEDGLVSVTGI